MEFHRPMWRVGFVLALYFSVAVLQIWAGDSPQTDLPVGFGPVKRENQCIDVLTIITRRQTSAEGLLELGVQMTLTPGCERGPDSIRTGAWPEFSKHLRYEFELATDSSGGESSHQRLAAQLLSEYQPVWREQFTKKTLEFQLTAEQPSIPAKFLLVTVLVDTERLETFKIPLPSDNAEKKKKKRKSTKQTPVKTS